MIFEIRLIFAGYGIGWVGIVNRGDKELYRTGKHHDSPEGALERVQTWLEDNGVEYA